MMHGQRECKNRENKMNAKLSQKDGIIQPFVQP